MLRDRLITAFLGLILLVGVLVSDSFVLSLGVVIIALFVLFELYQAYGLFDLPEKKLLAAVSAIIPVFVMFGNVSVSGSLFGLVSFAYVFIMLAATVFGHKSLKSSGVLTMAAATFIITMLLNHIILLRQMPSGKFLIWFIFIGAWVTDTFAYFTGRLLGKHKLMPDVSPKKTAEGAIGGIVGCGIVFFLYSYALSRTGIDSNLWLTPVFGMCASVVAQLGDLCASAVKRETGIKDFGSVFPGHGGVLDRFDSILFVAPFVYYVIVYAPIFN